MKTYIEIMILIVLSVGVYDQHQEIRKQEKQREAATLRESQAKVFATIERNSRELINNNCRQLPTDSDVRDCLMRDLISRDFILTIPIDGSR